MSMPLHDIGPMREYRRSLRKNQTAEEHKLWQYIRRKQLEVKFRRQHSIDHFIVDFYCPEKRLIIEIDGGVHIKEKDEDRVRDEFLIKLNYKVLRIENSEINSDIATVMERIKNTLISC
jgi:very-short-patch-repair endonuclease